MKNKDYHNDWSVTFILHSSFFILHSSFNLQPFVVAEALVAASDDSLSGL